MTAFSLISQYLGVGLLTYALRHTAIPRGRLSCGFARPMIRRQDMIDCPTIADATLLA